MKWKAATIENVVVGQVLSMEKHPDSDHLWVCQVSVGDDQPLQIVTGAQLKAHGHCAGGTGGCYGDQPQRP